MSYFGNLKDPQTGRAQWVDDFHTARASSVVCLIGSSFSGAKDTNFWTESITGTGSVTQTPGTIVLSTGATANSTSRYQTVRTSRWVPGQENTFRTVLRVGDAALRTIPGVGEHSRRLMGFSSACLGLRSTLLAGPRQLIRPLHLLPGMLTTHLCWMQIFTSMRLGLRTPPFTS